MGFRGWMMKQSVRKVGGKTQIVIEPRAWAWPLIVIVALVRWALQWVRLR